VRDAFGGEISERDLVTTAKTIEMLIDALSA
jgi:hypothetical protein